MAAPPSIAGETQFTVAEVWVIPETVTAEGASGTPTTGGGVVVEFKNEMFSRPFLAESESVMTP
jgi:hypothetical protein